MTFEEMQKLKPDKQEELFKALGKVRDQAKTTNYSALYGVGAKKLARELGISVSDAAKLLEAFWEVNWAVRATAKEQYLKTLKDGSVWLKNPVSGFYYNLRYEKDIWSTLNQGTGVYGFDTWIAYSQSLGVDIVLQMHDEVVVECDEDKVEEAKEILMKAITKTNEKLKLNVPLDIDIQVGHNYAEIH